MKDLEKQLLGIPRKHRRNVWRNLWKHRRDEIPGKTRQEQRIGWRAVWQRLRVDNGKRYRLMREKVS